MWIAFKSIAFSFEQESHSKEPIRLSEAPLSSGQDSFAWDSARQEMTVSAFSYIKLLLHAASFANGRSSAPYPPQL